MSKKHLSLSNELKLPVEVAGEAIGVLATRGAGKSYASAVLIEELWNIGIQFAVLDPTGVYWGLRAAANGSDAGLPVIVLGGPHGDVPIESTAGALIADLLVDTGQSLILDLSDFPTKHAQTKFVTDFAERLYRRKSRNRTSLHLVIDEADEFAPQKPMRDEARMVGAIEVIVRRGRSRGLGSTLITQRSAALNKNVLDVIDTLIAMRIGSPRDRKAVESWITAKALRDELGVMDSLPSLQTGIAWVWSPVRDILKQTTVRRIRTFDSYATPKPGQVRVEPKLLASIDLDKLGAQIKATADRVKENDPKSLKSRIRELESELNKKPAAAVEIKEIEVPVIKNAHLEQLKNLQDMLNRDAEYISAMKGMIGCLIDEMKALQHRHKAAPTPRQNIQMHTMRKSVNKPVSEKPENYSESMPSGGLRRMLIALAQRNGLTKRQLGVRAGLSSKSGTFGTYLGRARSQGWINGSGDQLQITETGLDVIGAYEPLPTGRALLDYWLNQLGNSGAARILQAAYESYPRELSKDELAEAAGLSAGSGTFGTYIGKLRTLELINGFKASEELFE